jgi:hypothetical protein
MAEGRRGVTPEEVVAGILVEFDQTTKPGYYVDYVHNWFRVYLNPDDFAQLKPFEDRIRDEGARALDERLNQLNGGIKGAFGGAGFTRKLASRRKRCERLGDWKIDFHWNDEVESGGLEVQSEGAAQTEPEPLEGPETIRRVPPGAEENSSSTRRLSEHEPPPKSAEVFATLTFDDDAGAHTFEMVKESINIGRGGANTFVDIPVMVAKDVSRLHCQIRRDPATGKFLIKDLSRFGTWVDGKRLPPSASIENGTERDLQIYVPLPQRAQISLAEKLTMQFSSGKPGKKFPWF